MNSEYKTLDDLKKTTRLTTGTVGVVSDAALLARMTSKALGVQIDAVPFDGEGEVMAALLGGHVNIAYFNPSEVLPQIQAGTLRALAVSTSGRVPVLKDVPTFTELGHPIVHTQMRGLVMPKVRRLRSSPIGRACCGRWPRATNGANSTSIASTTCRIPRTPRPSARPSWRPAIATRR